jgi:hypothetical protein
MMVDTFRLNQETGRGPVEVPFEAAVWYMAHGREARAFWRNGTEIAERPVGRFRMNKDGQFETETGIDYWHHCSMPINYLAECVWKIDNNESFPKRFESLVATIMTWLEASDMGQDNSKYTRGFF